MRTEIRGKAGSSSYFQGKFRGYGMYQWNIKFYDFRDDFEIEQAQRWVFGENLEYMNEVVGRTVDASIQGRSGGWLVIDTELTEAELELVDTYIKESLKNLPAFLKEERQLKLVEVK